MYNDLDRKAQGLSPPSVECALDPSPPESTTLPPLAPCAEAWPACSTASPPSLNPASPTLMRTSPPAPNLESPVPANSAPESPAVDSPDAILTAPLTPLGPEGDVSTDAAPDVPSSLRPLETRTVPPIPIMAG